MQSARETAGRRLPCWEHALPFVRRGHEPIHGRGVVGAGPECCSTADISVALHETTVRVRLESDRDILAARHQARALAHDAGFGLADLAIIATAISELGQNVLRYARCGDLEIEIIHDHGRRGIAIIASDQGPGIPDVELALQDGYSTAGSLGLGLPGVRRLMDDFAITSELGRGTTVTVRKWIG